MIFTEDEKYHNLMYVMRWLIWEITRDSGTEQLEMSCLLDIIIMQTSLESDWSMFNVISYVKKHLDNISSGQFTLTSVTEKRLALVLMFVNK